MGENELSNGRAEASARVVAAQDLAEVSADDIDAFLDSLDPQPFSEEQVQRLLGRLVLGDVSTSRPPASQRPAGARFESKRTARAGARAYRLACEELENRLPPSVYGAALGASALDLRPTVATMPLGETVRLWQGRVVMEVQSSADAWTERQGIGLRGSSLSPAVTATAVSGVFASDDYRDDEDAAARPDDEAFAGHTWETIYSDTDCASFVVSELQLAG
jgi:hypothetical protein